MKLLNLAALIFLSTTFGYTSGANEGNPQSVEDKGLIVFGGFEGASLSAVRSVGNDSFVVDCLQEPDVPEIAFNRVFYDYSFACGIRNESAVDRNVRVRLKLCPRSGRRNMKFMMGPYWVKEGRSWRHLPPSAHSKGEDWVEMQISIRPGRELILSTKPFWTASELKQILSEYEDRLPFVTVRSLGKTAEGRDIWVIETEERAQSVLISSSLQSAEFGGDVILFFLDWLGTKTKRTEELLEQFQFCLVPDTSPDGVAHGYSIMNAVGQCPMFDFGKAFAGEEDCAQETKALVKLLKEKKPALWLDLHVHPGRYDIPKLNPVKPEFYPTQEAAETSLRVQEAVLALCDEWRVVAIPLDDPDFTMRDSGLFLAAERLGTASYCFQDYALTEEGKKVMLVEFMDAALSVINGRN